MSKRWTHTAAFEHFGTTPRNIQWSWSARSEDGKTVVVTFWQDEFARENGRLIYSRPATDPSVARRPGHSELMDNFIWARDHCDGRFSVIMAIAKDKNASPRSIAAIRWLSRGIFWLLSSPGFWWWDWASGLLPF